jgi:hypothetical protein
MELGRLHKGRFAPMKILVDPINRARIKENGFFQFGKCAMHKGICFGFTRP